MTVAPSSPPSSSPPSSSPPSSSPPPSSPPSSSPPSSLIRSLAGRLSLGEIRPAQDTIRRAAVAIVLHNEPSPRVLLMKRAERASDPWSGHISLPGGGYQASDGELRITAIRETREEVGIDLGGARLIGSLPTVHPRSSGPKGVEVTPFVFATQLALEPVCGPEALAAFWLPIELAVSGALDGKYLVPSTQVWFPSWTYEGHVIWGLTRRILDELLATGREATAADGGASR